MDDYNQQDMMDYNAGGQMPYNSIPVSRDELYATAIQEERIRNIIEQLNPENQLRDIEWRIRGYKKNMMTGEWEKVDKDLPEPPKLLVMRFIGFLGSIMTQSLTQSNLTEMQINKIMKIVIEYVTDELDANANLYDLEDNYTERTRIGNIILNSTFFVMCRALNGMEAKRMWKALSLSENMGMENVQKSKWSDALKFWK